MLRKTALKLFFLVPLLIGLPTSCEEPCGPFEQTRLRVTGFAVKVSSTSNKFLDHDLVGRFVYEEASLIHKSIRSWGFSALACSPPPLTYDTDISEISITSDSNYRSDYLAGSDLIDLFAIPQYESLAFPLEIYSPFINFQLKTPPDEVGTHSFTIQIDLDDGRTFVDTTPVILITP